MSFKPGIQVICIKSHSDGVVKKGQTFFVESMKSLTCCNLLVLNIGIKTPQPIHKCSCGAKNNEKGRIRWLDARLFAPITADFKRMTFTEVIKEVLQSNNCL